MVFYRQEGDKSIIIVTHVDDLMIITSSIELMEEAKGALKKTFKISDMGEIHWILGFAIEWDQEKHTLSLLQEAYIKSVLENSVLQT